jgi:GNAT superfamily N-acetyltransferase
MELIYLENYWDRPQRKAEFIRFLVSVFHLDLSLWDRRGYWDHNYRPFSYFAGETLVSSVCLYSMDMVVAGRRCRVAQFSAVGTLPEYRRQGLSSQLTRKAMAWVGDSHDFYFLFADEEAFPFYQSCGFRRVAEHKTRIAVAGGTARPGARKLDINDEKHRKLIHRLAAERVPVSERLGILNEKLFMFWCLYGLGEYLDYIAELDLLVVYKRADGRLTMYDVVGQNIPSFDDIYPYLRDERDQSVDFLFMADKMRLANPEYVRIEENGTHLYGNFPLKHEKFIFPFTAHA